MATADQLIEDATIPAGQKAGRGKKARKPRR